MSSETQPRSAGWKSFLVVMAWMIGGVALGYALSRWARPDSDLALIVSVLAFPFSMFLGWLLMLAVALVAAPFLLPGVLSRLGRAQLRPKLSPADRQRRLRRIGWCFVLAALPLSLIAGLIAGAIIPYGAAGLLYGLGLRRTAAMYEVEFEA